MSVQPVFDTGIVSIAVRLSSLFAGLLIGEDIGHSVAAAPANRVSPGQMYPHDRLNLFHDRPWFAFRRANSAPLLVSAPSAWLCRGVHIEFL